MIGLITAMPDEAKPYLDRMENDHKERVGEILFHRGSLMGIDVVMLICGIGKVNAAMGAQAMIQKYAPSRILHSGVGGGLTPQMRIGDVVVGRNCVQYDVDTSALGDPVGMVSTVDQIYFPCDQDAARTLMQCASGRAFFGTIATGDRFLTHREDKQPIVDMFGALTCDQESCAIAQVCWIHHTPFSVVRGVSDVTDEEQGAEYVDHVSLAAGASAQVILEFLHLFGKKFL